MKIILGLGETQCVRVCVCARHSTEIMADYFLFLIDNAVRMRIGERFWNMIRTETPPIDKYPSECVCVCVSKTK